MSLRIPTRTLRTPRRPAGAERLVVRPRGNSPVRAAALWVSRRARPRARTREPSETDRRASSAVVCE